MRISHIRYMLFLLLPVLLLAGCQNPIDGQGPDSPDGPTTFTATIGGGDATKTTLGTPDALGVRPVHWSADDSLRIGGARYDVSQIDPSNPRTATFMGSGAQLDGGKYKAYYPASIYNGGSPRLPDTLAYSATRIDHLPMYAESPTVNLTFCNLCSVLEFRLTGTKMVGSITLESRADGKRLSGPFTPEAEGTAFKARMTGSAAADKRVVLDCTSEPGGGVLLDATTPKSFFVAIPVQEYAKDSLKVTVKDESGKVITAFHSRADTTVTYDRSKIYDVSKPIEPFFKVTYNGVTTTASGGGTAADGGSIPSSHNDIADVIMGALYKTPFVIETNLGGVQFSISPQADRYTGGPRVHVNNTLFPSGIAVPITGTSQAITLWRNFSASDQGVANYPISGSFTTIGASSGTFTPKPFTVSASGDKIYFSPGNLWYDTDPASTDKWCFAGKQYESLGLLGGNVNPYRYIDLFAWATSGWDGGTTFARTAYLPTSKSHAIADYMPAGVPVGDISLVGPRAQADWGVRNSPIDGKDWRLPTAAEMEYLLETRGISDTPRYLLAAIPADTPSTTITFSAADNPDYMVKYTLSKPRLKGLLLFPDGFERNKVMPISVRDSINTPLAAHQVITNWVELEGLGCVFLPVTTSVAEGIYSSGASPSQVLNGSTPYYTSTARFDGGNVEVEVVDVFSASYNGVYTKKVGLMNDHGYGMHPYVWRGPVRLVRDAVGVGTLSLSVPEGWVGDPPKTVAVTATDNTGNPVSSPQMSNWQSSDPTVAAVDNNGVVTPLKAGTTQISATWSYNGTTLNANTTFVAVDLVSVTVTSQTVNLNGSVQMPYLVTYQRGNSQYTTSDVSTINCWMNWASANPTNASVTSAGLATGHVAGTSTQLTVTIKPNATATRNVTGSGTLTVNSGSSGGGDHSFNVGDMKVIFAKGNVQYRPSTQEWRFAENQYDFVGGTSGHGGGSYGTVSSSSNSSVSSSYSGWIDLFGWATAGVKNSGGDYGTDYTHIHYLPHSVSTGQRPYTESASYNYYGYGPGGGETPSWAMVSPTNIPYGSGPENTWQQNFNLVQRYCDWGVHFDQSGSGSNSRTNGNTWFTLSAYQWNYLIRGRTNYYNLWATARIEISSGVFVVGIIFLPDDWVLPANCKFTSGGTMGENTPSGNPVGANHYVVDASLRVFDPYSQTYRDNGLWQDMEDAGAIFLPAAGYRDGQTYIFHPEYQYSDTGLMKFNFCYWTSSASNAESVGYLPNSYAYYCSTWERSPSSEILTPPGTTQSARRYAALSVRLVRKK